jgi:hypothetical protein
MINETTTPIVIELAKALVGLARNTEGPWKVAFLRFARIDGVSEVKASVQMAGQIGAQIVSAVSNSGRFAMLSDLGDQLLDSIGKDDGLCLVRVNAHLDYDVLFEYEDFSRWQISKLDGGSGIPAGVSVQ